MPRRPGCHFEATAAWKFPKTVIWNFPGFQVTEKRRICRGVTAAAARQAETEVVHRPNLLSLGLPTRLCIDPFGKDFCPPPAMEAFLSVRRQLAPGGPTVAGDPRESTPGRVPWSRAWIPAREALERHTGDSLLDALVQASTGHNAARRPPRPGWSASELRPGPSCMSASAVAAAGPPDGRQSLPSVCCRGRARDS